MENKYQRAINKICKKGNLNLMKSYLYTKEMYIDKCTLFYIACKNGHLHILNYLFTILTNEIHNKLDYHNLFYNACFYKHIHIFKYLTTKIHDKIYINIDRLFYTSYYYYYNPNYNNQIPLINKDIYITKYLLSLPNHNIDIKKNDNEVFRFACKTRNIELIQLISLHCKELFNNEMIICAIKQGYIDIK